MPPLLRIRPVLIRLLYRCYSDPYSTAELEAYQLEPVHTDGGELYTAAARGADTSKPRPVALVQDDRFDATSSVTVCPLTTDPTEAPLLRISVPADAGNGLSVDSTLMVDKLTTMRREALRERLGRLDEEVLLRLSRALVVFLGIA